MTKLRTSNHWPRLFCTTVVTLAFFSACGGVYPGNEDGSVDNDGGSLLSARGIQRSAITEPTACPTLRNNRTDITCYSTSVPENYEIPDGRRIKIFTLVRPSLVSPHRGTIFLLAGGPGDDGLSFFSIGTSITDFARSGWDVVIIAHRGTQSSRITCAKGLLAMEALSKFRRERGGVDSCAPNEHGVIVDTASCEKESSLTAEMQSCGKELVESLGGGDAGASAANQYNTVNASRDIIATLPALHRNGEVVLLGVSYGTFWASRAAQLFPEIINKVILDSPLGLTSNIGEYDLYYQDAVEGALDDCIQNDRCHKNLGFDTGKEALSAAYRQINSGNCYFTSPPSAPLKYSPWSVSRFEKYITRATAVPEMRPLLPYFVAVAARCDLTRLKELDTVFKKTENNYFPAYIPSINNVLYNTVVFTELLNQNDPAVLAKFAEIAEQLKNRPVGTATAWALNMKDAIGWEFLKFTSDPKSYSTYRSPTLILTAKYDLATPTKIADEVRVELEKVRVPVELYRPSYAAHVVTATGNNTKLLNGQCGINRVIHYLNRLPPETFNCPEALVDWNFEDSTTVSRNRREMGYPRNNPWDPVK